MIRRDEATQAQVDAADPVASTWLAANAGSGKTSVLTDRVARLLLEGVNPQHILCLTYTKAAASEMQNRLFKRLGKWAMAPEADLVTDLHLLGAGIDLPPDRIARARTLFAQAIETPGGLKIQTIHAFCGALLRRFPLEAGVAPNFMEVEERAASLLRADILDDLAEGPEAHLIEGVAQFFTDQNLEGLTREITEKRSGFEKMSSEDELRAVLGLAPGETEEQIVARVFLGEETLLIDRLRTVLLGSQKSTDVKAGHLLAAFDGPGLDALPLLESQFLFGPRTKTPYGAKIGSFPTKDLRESNPDLMSGLEPFMKRIEAAREPRLALAALGRSTALYRFAKAFLPEYARRKQIMGWLDFDDLILKTRALLTDPAVAQWVLFRLDGGIDHILVDEAQDTSRVQWDVIERIAQEFTGGVGARADVARTLFVVGDKKQSIYSFQGADPKAFDQMRDDFRAQLAGSDTPLVDRSLDYSFRSASSILKLVDHVFDGQAEAGFTQDTLHKAFKSDLPGRVDLWPFMEEQKDETQRDWRDPVDRPSDRDHFVQLAEHIAGWIKTLIESGATIPVSDKERRPIRPGDIMILLERRKNLFPEIIRACKKLDLPMAGADRLKVGAELAVKDLAALLRFVETPEDSLSLAEALRSPLFGWSEQAIYDLAHKRDEKYLWTALRNRADTFPQTMGVLTDLRRQSDFLRPYDLIERILTRHDGRRRLLARLGPEAEDGINAFLSQALAYERTEIPGLSGFMSWMQTDDLDIKRSVAGSADVIRVMTVHGAKGLEAPIVILPEPITQPPADRGEVLEVGSYPLWKPKAAEMPASLRDSQEAAKQKREEERQRLLYVALTRAEKWLVVAGAGRLDKSGKGWHAQISAAMHALQTSSVLTPTGQGLRLSNGDWEGGALLTQNQKPRELPPVPYFMNQPAMPPLPGRNMINPSDMGGAKALPGADADTGDVAKARGTRLHLLLEKLPGSDQSTWRAKSRLLLPDIDDAVFDAEYQIAQRVLNTQELSFLFTPDSLAEVPITADFGAHRLHGVIDRLVITKDRVLAVDFKSNLREPEAAQDCPDGILRQMGAYAFALRQIYPDLQIETAILWLRTARLMHVPHDLVNVAPGTLDLDDVPAPTYLHGSMDSQE